MIKVEKLDKTFGKKQVLHAVDLELCPGEIHGLIGENAAGKTTLMKCIAGIYQIGAGTITCDDEVIFDNPKVKEMIGYVADYNEYIHFYSVEKMVKLYCNFYDSFDKQKFNDYNQVFQIPVTQKVGKLSKGQKMRLAFMLELSKCPKYLIMDEPTSGLDPIAKANFFEMLIREVEENDIGVLISSHNLDGLEKICDKVTYLHDGKVKKQMELDAFKGELTKLNVVFEGGAGKGVYDLPQIVKISNVGSIYSMVVKGYNEGFHHELSRLGASLVEPVDISLEEMFVALGNSEGE